MYLLLGSCLGLLTFRWQNRKMPVCGTHWGEIVTVTGHQLGGALPMTLLFGGQVIETSLQNQGLTLIFLCPFVVFLEHLPGTWWGFRDLDLPFKVQTICTPSSLKGAVRFLAHPSLRVAFFSPSLHFPPFWGELKYSFFCEITGREDGTLS